MNPLFLLAALFGAGALTRLMGSEETQSDARGLYGAPTDEEFIDDFIEASSPKQTPSSPIARDPTPAPLPDEITVPDAPEQTGGTGEDGGSTAPIAGGDSLEVMTGRVSTLSVAGDDAVSVRILSDVAHGHVTVNPDNTLALVLTNTDHVGTDKLSYEVTHADGSSTVHEIALKVTPGAQQAGWATGRSHYMLETDEDDRIVVEHGDNHVKVFCSGSNKAWSLEKIAVAEGLAASDIDGAWLSKNGYGFSEGKALDEAAAKILWAEVSPEGSVTSNWFLYERGYEYGLENRLERGLIGEDELHPVYFGAWGEGADPLLKTQFKLGYDNDNVVVQGLAFDGGMELKAGGGNALLDDLYLTSEMVIMHYDAVTIRGSHFFDIHHDDPKGDDWSGADRISAIFANFNGGVLFEHNILDLNGWEEGYDFNLSGDDPQPPSLFSHNVYFGDDNVDVTIADTISMRGSSHGLIMRTGGYFVDNVSIEDNIGMYTAGGDYKGAGPVDSYTLFLDNLVTSAGHKDALGAGGMTVGINDDALMSSLVDNIVAHLADPNNYEEFLDKYTSRMPIKNSTTSYYDDTIVFNWVGSQSLEKEKDFDKNHEGLDEAVLNKTTIQLFAAQLLGKPDATISDLGDYLRAQGGGAFEDVVDADLIIRFFQEGFGIAPEIRGEAETLRFVPSDLGDGVRWDNRLNWTTDDLPGTQDGDSVDLGGNHVVFGTNAKIENLDLGPNGELAVFGGKLSVDGTLSGEGDLIVEGAGQLWVSDANDVADDVDLHLTGGRFANTGEISGLDIDVTGGQAILATDDARFEVSDGQRLALFDSAAKVGFDGEEGGIAVLDFDHGSTLSYSARNGDLDTISEFRSGAMGEAPDVLSGIDLQGATVEIDVHGLSAEAGKAFTLMEADEIAGVLKATQISNLGAYDARLVVDYEADAVRLELTAGSGKVSVDTVGAQTDVDAGHDALWAALTADHGVASESEWPGDEEVDILAA